MGWCAYLLSQPGVTRVQISERGPLPLASIDWETGDALDAQFTRLPINGLESWRIFHQGLAVLLRQLDFWVGELAAYIV